jgi:dTDP-4-dehydrorhamnose reductase
MRALVIGASGQVGRALLDALGARDHTVLGTHHRTPAAGTRPLDLADTAAVARLVADIRPDWIFCAGALTHVDYCEDHPAEASLINRDGPGAVAAAAGRLGAGVVFFSTDYVFDGHAGPYAEEDPPGPLSVYGRTKLEGEHAVMAAAPRAVIVRTAGVYGPDPQEKNFVSQLIRRCRAGERMRVPADQVSTPTYTLDLAGASVELAEREVVGVVHVAGPTVLDRHAFAREAAAVFDLDPSLISPVATASLGPRAPRPLRGGLRVDRARRILATRLRSAREGLEAMRKAIAGPEPVR